MRFSIGAVVLASLVLVLAASAQAQTVKIELTSLTTMAVVQDSKPKGAINKGDRIVFRDLLKNRAAHFGKKRGDPVAWDKGTITYRNATQRVLFCVTTFPGFGTITYAGLFEELKDGSTVVPITGGTGAFKGAKGFVTIGPGTASSVNAYLVTVPHRLDIDSTAVA